MFLEQPAALYWRIIVSSAAAPLVEHTPPSRGPNKLKLNRAGPNPNPTRRVELAVTTRPDRSELVPIIRSGPDYTPT